jgi:hypothetical protein
MLEHMARPSATLSRFATWLHPGGRLLFVVPNPEGLGHRLRGPEWFAYRDPTHVSLLSFDEWLAAKTGAGFVLERAGTDGLWDPPYFRGLRGSSSWECFACPPPFRSWARLLPPSWGHASS